MLELQQEKPIMHSSNNNSKRRAIAEINVVPYVDVSLVLLVIFMVTTPLITQGVQVDLPTATTQALPKEKEAPVVVTVDAMGSIYLSIAAINDWSISIVNGSIP